MENSIKMEVTKSGFVLSFDRPGRVEVTVANPLARTDLVAHVYDGSVTDMEQDPLFAYDGSISENASVTR